MTHAAIKLPTRVKIKVRNEVSILDMIKIKEKSREFIENHLMYISLQRIWLPNNDIDRFSILNRQNAKA